LRHPKVHKNKVVYLWLLVAWLLTITNLIHAQQTWTLQQCISHALENNTEVIQGKLNTKISEADKNAARYSMWPDARLGADFNYHFGRSYDKYLNEIVNEPNRNDDYYFRSEWPLFQGGKLYHQKKYYQHLLRANQSALENTKFQLSVEVAMTYFQVLYNQELLAVAYNQDSLMALQVEQTEKRRAVGKITQGDVFDIKAQYAREKYNLARAKANLETAQRDLIYLMGIDSTKASLLKLKDEVGATLPTDSLVSVSYLYKQTSGDMPSIQKARWGTETAKNRVAHSTRKRLLIGCVDEENDEWYSEFQSIPMPIPE